MITVDGKQTDASGTLLDVCRRVGADVPALCFDERVAAAGHCRACMVESGGRMVAACATQARDGMVVSTTSPRVREYRRDLGELMVSEAAPRGEASGVLERWGVTGGRYPAVISHDVKDESHPYLRFDMSACIHCRLCVRVCSDVQGRFVYAMQNRGAEATVSWGAEPFSQTACVSCGACASACPSGAISDVDRQRTKVAANDRVVRTTCGYCGVGCQLEAHTNGDGIHFIDGVKSSPVNKGHTCVKGRYAHRFVRHPARLTRPLVRKNGELVPASWEEAIATVAEGMLRLKGHIAAISSARCTNEENYLVQKWFRAGLGTHNVDCCARVCHAPSAAGMRQSFGTGAATNSLEDLELADLLFVSGANATEAHPVVGARIKEAVLAGARLVVIDPRQTEIAQLADVHLQLRPGTNVPLFNSLAAVLVDEALVDEDFIASRTEGWETYRTFIARFAPEKMEPITGVSAALVRRAARLYGEAERPMQVHGLGMTEHLQGSEGVMLLCNLAMLAGAVGRRGVGVNPLRGQNNVQGAADMGCQPDLLTGYARPDDPKVKERFERIWGRPLPSDEGLTIPRMYEAIRSGELRGMFILGEDVVQTDPDVDEVIEMLKSLELLVVQEIFLSETAKLAHVVLPAASFLEKDGTFTNGERRVQRVREVVPPPGEARPDWRILLDLMKASRYPQPFTHPADVMDEVASLVPSFAGVSYRRLDENGLQWPVPDFGHPGTPILHAQAFTRGRGLLSCVDYVPSPELANAAGRLMLITGRVLEHYNSGSMTRRTDNVRLREADELELHPDDAHARGVSDGMAVRIKSEHGEATAVARITERVRRGTLFLSFHFPATGTNRVIGDVQDRMTDCPEYKLTAVEVVPVR